MNYTNQEKIEAGLKRNLTDSEALLLEDLIPAMDAYINRYTGRSWKSIGDYEEFEERYFDGNGLDEIFIDDFTELSELSIDDEVKDEDDYYIYPTNTEWKSSIYLTSGKFPKGRKNIKVTAYFSSGEIPADVSLVATSLCIGFFRKSEIGGELKKESIEGYSYELQSSAEIDSENKRLISILDTYKRVRF